MEKEADWYPLLRGTLAMVNSEPQEENRAVLLTPFLLYQSLGKQEKHCVGGQPS